MKKLLFPILAIAALQTQAQPVPRQLIVEHFTNTYCSVCANRNPGFYSNLAGFPDVLHIAYHPSAPYAACPLNQHNKPENDSRTNFYGIYGATPRIVIQGVVIPANVNYGADTLFSNRQGQTSAFAMSTRLELSGSNSLEVTVVIRKADTSSLDSLDLYAALAEDTLHFTGNNGETLQQDVFRKAFFGTAPMRVNLPVNVGDSVVFTQSTAINSAWVLSQCYAIAIASTADKKIEQAAASSRLPDMPTGIANRSRTNSLQVYPVPASGRLWLREALGVPSRVEVTDVSGKRLSQQTLAAGNREIGLPPLSTGIYFLRVRNEKGVQVVPFSHR